MTTTSTSCTSVLFTVLPTMPESWIFPKSGTRPYRGRDARLTVDPAADRGRAAIGQDGDMPEAFNTRVLNVVSGATETVVDLTRQCEAFLREVAAGRDGLLNVFVPHATAGVA